MVGVAAAGMEVLAVSGCIMCMADVDEVADRIGNGSIGNWKADAGALSDPAYGSKADTPNAFGHGCGCEADTVCAADGTADDGRALLMESGCEAGAPSFHVYRRALVPFAPVQTKNSARIL